MKRTISVTLLGSCTFFFCLFLFFPPPNTCLIEGRQSLYNFRRSRMTCSLFPDSSHPSQMKKVTSDSQWQMPWLRCKNKMMQEEDRHGDYMQGINVYSTVSASSNLLFRGCLREGSYFCLQTYSDCLSILSSFCMCCGITLYLFQTELFPYYTSFIPK